MTGMFRDDEQENWRSDVVQSTGGFTTVPPGGHGYAYATGNVFAQEVPQPQCVQYFCPSLQRVTTIEDCLLKRRLQVHTLACSLLK